MKTHQSNRIAAQSDKKLVGLLQFLGMSLEDIHQARQRIMASGRLPWKLVIPGGTLLGLHLEFGDVEKPTVISKEIFPEVY